MIRHLNYLSPNMSHPLNKGLVAWWLVSPMNFGGFTLRDIVRNHHGTLTNMASSAWRGSNRPGGHGALDINAGTEHVTMAGMPTITTNRLTISAWINPDVLTRGDIITRWNNGGTSGDQFNLLYGLTSGKPQFFISDGIGTDNSGVGSTVMSTGTWNHIVGTWDGTNIRVYLNGLEESSGTSVKSLSTASPPDTLIGNSIVPDGPLNAKWNDGRVYERALSANELSALYTESLYGNTNTLNWISHRALVVPAAAGTRNPLVMGSTNLLRGKI